MVNVSEKKQRRLGFIESEFERIRAERIGQSKVKVALEYAQQGWQVLPIYEIDDGKCACGKRGCNSPGKHPRTMHGLKDATTDQRDIKKWWEKWPNANIGIATGKVSGLMVLDIDPRNGGEDTLDEIENNNGRLPKTLQSITGSGGTHFYFRHPGGNVKSRANALGKGVDVKADGGYVVAPYSLHVSNRHYDWYRGTPDTQDVLVAPKWLLAKLIESKKQDVETLTETDGTNEKIPVGERNDGLTRLAGFLRGQLGMETETIGKVLLGSKNSLCEDPSSIPDSEIETIAQGMERYPAEHHSSFNQTDTGNAELFAALYRDEVLWCEQWGKWLIWDGSRWKKDTIRQVQQFAKRTVRTWYTIAAHEPDDTKRQKTAKWAASSENERRIKALMELAKGELATPAASFDANTWLFNCQNGTVDLRTGEIGKHRPTDFITKLAPVEYDPNIKSSLWLKFIGEIMDGDDELIDYLQRLTGIFLTGDISEQILPIFYGTGANGKSTFLDTVLGYMGDYASKAPPHLLTVKRFDEHPTEIADLFGKRLIVASETEQGGRMKVQRVKELTGDATLKGRYMHRDYFEFPRICKTVLVTNNKPNISESSHAIWRRIRLIDFGVTVALEKQDHQLLDKLKKEWPGVLRWAVEGCLLWQQYGLISPESVKHATRQYQDEENKLAEFLDMYCETGKDKKIAQPDMYHAYLWWAKEAGERYTMSRKVLYEQIRRIENITSKQLVISGKQRMAFAGIGLKPEWAHITDEPLGHAGK
ncbi:MAG: bifunctional DNA primase/polymerase [Phycisphaerae bacterium]|nr:bifunctional DNA primase/polymerase [Phycisphaerae bacterium]